MSGIIITYGIPHRQGDTYSAGCIGRVFCCPAFYTAAFPVAGNHKNVISMKMDNLGNVKSRLKGTMTEALFGQNVWLIAAIAFFAIVVMWWFLQTFAPNLLKAINPFAGSVTDLANR